MTKQSQQSAQTLSVDAGSGSDESDDEFSSARSSGSTSHADSGQEQGDEKSDTMASGSLMTSTSMDMFVASLEEPVVATRAQTRQGSQTFSSASKSRGSYDMSKDGNIIMYW